MIAGFAAQVSIDEYGNRRSEGSSVFVEGRGLAMLVTRTHGVHGHSEVGYDDQAGDRRYSRGGGVGGPRRANGRGDLFGARHHRIALSCRRRVGVGRELARHGRTPSWRVLPSPLNTDVTCYNGSYCTRARVSSRGAKTLDCTRVAGGTESMPVEPVATRCGA